MGSKFIRILTRMELLALSPSMDLMIYHLTSADWLQGIPLPAYQDIRVPGRRSWAHSAQLVMASFNSIARTSLLGVLTWFTCSALCQSPRPTASVTNGTVVGVELPSFHQEFFGGIPFAQPPVGDLRLRLPVSINYTFPNGTFDASEYSGICPGHGGDDVGCVFLYTSSSGNSTHNLP